METILQVKNLSKKYKNKEVLKNINMNVFKGDIYGFIGPNGAGKTTTIKTILGLLKPSNGEVYVEGKNVVNDKNIGANIGAMIDYPSFYGNLSGYKNLMLYANVLNLSKKRVDEVLEIVKLSHAKDKKVSNYSMGMKQRLAVARAFLTNPKIVILDEPTNGLDPEGVKEMRELIKELAKVNNTTFIYCSHILNEVQNLCNRVAIINKGNILVEDEISNLLNSNSESYEIITEEKTKVKEILDDVALKIIDIDNGVKIEINEGDFNLVNSLIVKNNINITTISKNKNSLENYFLNKIGV
ncbi:ABC transporter ATP-binding protein [Clostridium taeniosporum]|uniref:Bacitracin ABC transporter ATP-binding protein n=1 Tax=Clostridium taeniosporum TaxID=394958 RepID=A0A1D7XNU8_9CLOT|nr:ABC transporter ATP-binding protein [Clostridium taeniosporum]AOR25015.1 bacitracin ABC transporter ATP-binding protein [Clostridium taeniosporum]